MTHPSIHARATPEKPAYIMAGSGEIVTYRQLDERSNRGAQLFRARGLRPGDPIALCVENDARFFEICWAAQRAGLRYTPISTRLTASEIAYIVADCEARLFIASSRLPPVETPIERYAVGGAVPFYLSWEDAVARQPATPVADEICGYDMLYSSGTTGRPKGIRQPFGGEPIGTLTPLQRLAQSLYGLGPDTVYLSPAPLYHAAPLRFTTAVMAIGGTAIIMEKFDAAEFLQLIERHRVTHTQLVPTMLVRLLRLAEAERTAHDLSSLRCAIHAAAPCPLEVKAAMIAWWGPVIHEYYAATEGIGFTAIDTPQWLAHKGSVGRAVVGEVKIVGEDGAELPPRETGIVYFANGRPFTYHNDPEKTRRAFNDKGWATVGDVGWLDEEGYLYLTDRKDFMIISGGVNIYPQEAENTLVLHPGVADAAVFGVPNAEYGEEVKAVVQPVDMRAAGPALEAELIAFCRERLSPLKCPRSIDFLAELPRHPTGKLYKRLLKERYWK